MIRFTFGQITFITVCAFPSFPELHFKPFDFGLWISSAFKVCSLHHFNCVLLRAIDPRDCCTASAFRCISPVFDAISNAYDMCPKVKHSQPSRLLHSKCIPQVCLPTYCMQLYIYMYYLMVLQLNFFKMQMECALNAKTFLECAWIAFWNKHGMENNSRMCLLEDQDFAAL